MTLYARQQKRQRCKEQTFGLCGKGEGGMIWDDSIVYFHVYMYNMYITICEIDCQSRFDAWDRVLRAGATGMTLRDGVEREVGGGVQNWEHMYTHGWFMSMYGKNHYNIVKELASN